MEPTYAGPPPIALARILKGLTQRQLAERVGMSRGRLGELEHGASPNLRTARALANALDTDLDRLFPPNGEGPAAYGSSTIAAAGTRDVPSA